MRLVDLFENNLTVYSHSGKLGSEYKEDMSWQEAKNHLQQYPDGGLMHDIFETGSFVFVNETGEWKFWHSVYDEIMDWEWHKDIQELLDFNISDGEDSGQDMSLEDYAEEMLPYNPLQHWTYVPSNDITDYDEIVNTPDVLQIPENICEAKMAWARTGKKVVRKYRCTSGARKGRIVSNAAQCGKPIDMKKRQTLKKTKARLGGMMKRKAKKTKRVNPASKRLKTMNRR